MYAHRTQQLVVKIMMMIHLVQMIVMSLNFNHLVMLIHGLIVMVTSVVEMIHCFFTPLDVRMQAISPVTAADATSVLTQLMIIMQIAQEQEQYMHQQLLKTAMNLIIPVLML